MVNRLYVKLGSIGLCIVAITLGVGIGLSRRNKSSAAINAAKSTATDSDLPWCPDETRRKLVVPGTESFYSATDNLRLRRGTGTVRRNLGQTFEESEAPMKPTPQPNTNTPFPTGDDEFLDDPPIVNDPLIAVPGIMKGTSSPSIAPSSSAKPSAAVLPACKTKSPSPSSNIDKCVPSSRRGLGTEVTPNPTVCACPPEETRRRRKLGSEISSTLSPAPTICSSMRTEAPSPPPSPCDGTDDCPDVPEIITPPPTLPCDGSDCPDVPELSTTPPSPSPNAVVCPPCPGDRTTLPTPFPSTKFPTREPSPDATPNPTKMPTRPPTPLPTNQPTPSPTMPPSPAPTNQPTPVPSPNPTRPPTPLPTNQPTPVPSPNPTKKPTSNPTVKPTPRPTTPVPTMDTMPSQAPTPIATSVLTSQGSNEGTVTVSTETTGPPTMPGREP